MSRYRCRSTIATRRPTGPDTSRARHERRAAGSGDVGAGTRDCIARRLWGMLPPVRITLVANPGSGRDTDPDVLAAALRARGAERRSASDRRRRRGRAVGPRPGPARRRRRRRLDRALRPGRRARRACRSRSSRPGTANDFARAHGPAARPRAGALHRRERRPADDPHRAAARRRPAVRERRLHGPRRHRRAPGPAAEAEARPARLRGGRRSRGPTADPIALRIRVDGEEAFDGEAWHVIVGGDGRVRRRQPPRAARTQTDELLDVAIVERRSRSPSSAGPGACGAARSRTRTASATSRAAHVEMDVPPGDRVQHRRRGLPACDPVAFDVDPGGVDVVVPR